MFFCDDLDPTDFHYAEKQTLFKISSPKSLSEIPKEIQGEQAFPVDLKSDIMTEKVYLFVHFCLN